jgi:hypothetical protein
MKTIIWAYFDMLNVTNGLDSTATVGTPTIVIKVRQGRLDGRTNERRYTRYGHVEERVLMLHV